MNPVEELYDNNPQREWQREERHRTEFAVTRLALRDYLPEPPAAILDIGGGPGRYAIPLTGEGYAVTLVDLSRKNLDLAREKAAAAGVEITAVIHGNALQLPPLPETKYDAVLLLGPLYHLLERSERLQVLAETRRVLTLGGILFAAFITRFAPFRDMAAKGYLDWLVNHAQRAESILESGENPAMPGNSFPNSYFAHPDEIQPLMTKAGFRMLTLIGCEGVVAGHEAHINQLTGELWEKWVALNYRLGQDQVLHGAADHLLYIGQCE